MQRLDLDFCAGARPSAWAGRLLLVVALAVGADLALTYRELAGAVAQGREQLAALQPREPAPPASSEELAAARDSVQRLSLPWEALFGALESAASERVALLSIEPDPRTGKVLITGEGRDYLGALTYVLELERAGGLDDVELVRHELRREAGPRPVAFSVSASWRDGR